MSALYALCPKWLLMILVVALLATSAYVGTKMWYFKLDNAKLKNDNKILADNAVALKNSLDTCTRSLKAEADNATSQAGVTTETQTFKKKIDKTNVKEKINATTLADAIKLSNGVSDRLHSR